MDHQEDQDLNRTKCESNRRGFLIGSTALALGVTCPGSLFAPNRGGRFRLGLHGGSTGDNLDPAFLQDFFMMNVIFGQIRNCLTEIAPDGSLVGELAEDWESSSDAATWMFKLRKGIEFHNGKTLEAEDVVASLNHHLGERSKSAAKHVLRPIANVSTDGKHRVVLDLHHGNADIPYLMADFHLGICPANPNGSIDWRSGTGTGGYVLRSFEPGVRTLTLRNQNYWKEGRAHFDEVETIDMGASIAETSNLLTGTIDALAPVTPKDLDYLNRLSGVRVVRTTGNGHFTLPMWTDTEPYDNNDLRLALKYAVDRQAWLDIILKGQGELGNDHPIGPANRFRATADELPQRTYDLDKSKYHLRKAGYDNIDLTIHLSTAAFKGAILAGELLSESSKSAGINIRVVKEPPDRYWDRVWLQKPWCGSYWAGRPTEDWMFRTAYETGAVWNETKWSNGEFMKLLNIALVELNEAKRRDLYVELQRILHNQGGAIIPVFQSDIHAISETLGTPATWGNDWLLDGQKCAERWWFR
jgi:peptide/nickel transport system substrate-binding protein